MPRPPREEGLLPHFEEGCQHEGDQDGGCHRYIELNRNRSAQAPNESPDGHYEKIEDYLGHRGTDMGEAQFDEDMMEVVLVGFEW